MWEFTIHALASIKMTFICVLRSLGRYSLETFERKKRKIGISELAMPKKGRKLKIKTWPIWRERISRMVWLVAGEFASEITARGAVTSLSFFEPCGKI